MQFPFELVFRELGGKMLRTGLVTAIIALAMGCSSHVGPTHGKSETDDSLDDIVGAQTYQRQTQAAGFIEIPREVDESSDAAGLEELALAGTVANPTEELGTRLQIRKIKVPKPARGSTSLFNFEGAKRGWVTALPGGDQLPTPAYSDGKVFVSGGFASRYFFAFDAFNGESQWSLRAPDGGPSSAIIEDKKVVFNAESCVLFVADADTGKIIWQRWLSVFFNTFDGTAHRLRVSDGKVEWKRDIGATSAMWVHGDRVLTTRKLGSGKKALEQTVVLAADSGKLMDKGEKFKAPYLAGGSRDRRLIHAQAGAWGQVRDSDHLALKNVAAGWAFQGSSPSISMGSAYFAVGGEIRAADIATGKTRWRRTVKDGADAQSVSPPAVVGSQLVYGTIDGHLFFSDIDTGMAIRAYDIGEPILQQPIVAQGWVYLTTAKGRLIGLELADHKFDGWHMWAGNAQHSGPVTGAGVVEPALVASRARPHRGTLQREGADLPLEGTKVKASISGFVARVDLEQTFVNPMDKVIEAVYLFPLPDHAAVDDMKLHIGDRVIEAKIKRKEAAKKTYEAAKKAGKKAALLEQQRPTLFAQRVANIPAKSSVKVQISYVHTLPLTDSTYEYVYPMGGAGNVDLSVSVDAGMPIESMSSATHDITVKKSELGAVVHAASAKTKSQEFRLRYSVAGELPRAAVLATRGEDSGYFSLVVQPPADPKGNVISARNMIFVVDTSPSMRGLAEKQASAVVEAARAGLRKGDTLDVVEVSDPAKMTASLSKALASLGKSAAGTPMLVLISDGYIANEAQVLKAVAGHVDQARMFTLGVGAAVNRFLLERAAEVGRGRMQVAALSEPAKDVAEKFVSLIDRPVFTDIAVDWGGLEVTDVYPRRLPDVFAGSPLVVHGRFDKGGTHMIRVRGSVGAKRYMRMVNVTLPDSDVSEHGAQRTVWARAAIRDRLSRIYLRDNPALVEEVTKLGLAYRQVTPYTSFVAVEGIGQPTPVSKATVSPARALPGDPEVRIPAPRDARQVTVVLPFGESVEAQWEPDIERWTARFLIPSDASEGGHPIDILITLADGSQEHTRIHYTVDSAKPKVNLEVLGEAKPGNRIILRAKQYITNADLAQTSITRSTLTDAKAQLLSDAKRVSARMPSGGVLKFAVSGPGQWEAEYVIPDDATGRLTFEVVVVDLAANVGTQQFDVEVSR
jgi:Ca-activated chloride channel family protein